MKEMYKGVVNSPSTSLTASIGEATTSFEVLDGSKLPEAPNLATIGRTDQAETILYATKTGNVLSGITRGFQGTAKTWETGSQISRNFTEYDLTAVQDNLEAHLNTDKPHLIQDVGASKTYRYGFKQDGEHLVFIYEEV